MPGNLLAEEMVRITADGLLQVDQQVDSLGVKFGKMSDAVRKAEDFVKRLGRAMTTALTAPQRLLQSIKERADRLAKSMAAIGKPSALLTLGGAFGLGGLLRGAASGTVEADRFGKAMEYLARVVGDQFAPYVRMATRGLIEIADAFRALTPETKASIASWTLWGVTLAGAVAVLPIAIKGVAMFASGLAALTGALGLCINPTFVAIAGFVALGAATVGAFADMDEAEMRWLKNHGQYMELAAKFSDNFFRRHSEGVADFLQSSGRGFGYAITAALEKIGVFAPGTLRGVQMDEEAEIRNKAAAKARAIEAAFAPVKKAMEGIEGIRNRGNKGGAFGFLDGLGGAMERIKKAGAGGGFAMKLDVKFESAQQTWDRLQIAFAEQGGRQVEIGQLQLNEAKIGNDRLQQAVIGIGKIADKGPLIK